MKLTINIYNKTTPETTPETPTNTTTETVEPAVSSVNVFQPLIEIDREFLKSIFDRELLSLKNNAKLSVTFDYIKYLMDKYDG